PPGGCTVNVITDTLAWLTDANHWTGPAGIPTRLAEHLALSAVSIAVAIALAIPIGIYIGHTGRYARLVVNSANLWRALPSLALIRIVPPFTSAIDPQLGFKVYPTLVAMVVLAAPPFLVNTQAATAAADRAPVDSARTL